MGYLLYVTSRLFNVISSVLHIFPIVLHVSSSLSRIIYKELEYLRNFHLEFGIHEDKLYDYMETIRKEVCKAVREEHGKCHTLDV